MREALKLCVEELRDARCEVEEVMHNCAAALAGTEKGARRVAEYRRQLARIDAAVAAAEAALALPEPEPVVAGTAQLAELIRLWREPYKNEDHDSCFVEFARAVERAHGITGEQK